jgi:hypothetical protein
METDTVKKADLLDGLDLSVHHWRPNFIAEGVLALFVCFLFLTLSVSSISFSKRQELFHLSNQVMNLLQVGLAFVVIIIVRMTWGYQEFY